MYDVVIVGAGPVGLACAITARRGGLRYLVVEKGCLVNSVFHFPVNMTFFTTPELMEIGNYPITISHGKPTRQEALQYYRSVAGAESLAVHTYEKVLGLEGKIDDFRVLTESRDGRQTYRTRRVVLATGYFDNPNYLGITGEDLPQVSHYYTEAHPYADQRVMVVGGKNSACEAALDLFRHGAQVTLVHRGSELGDTVKYWVRPDVEHRIAAGEVRALFECRVVEIRQRSAVLERKGAEPWEEPFDQVFLLTGYHPDEGLLRGCGLEPHPGTLRVQLDAESLESLDRPGVHLAGSVSAGRETGTVFIENGRFDCEKIFRYLLPRLQAAATQ